MMSIRARATVAALLASTALLSGCGFHGLYSANLPGGANTGSHPFDVTIYFRDVLDLVPQSAVKVNDVAVGKVVSISLSGAKDPTGDPATNGWTAKVKVQVNGSVDLPSNARAAVQMTSLLGEKYVSLEQPVGAGSATRLANGDSIPVTRTDTAPEVEEVLGALSLLLNEGGVAQIRTITTELNNAFRGNESTVRDLIAQLNTFATTLDKNKDDITTALDNINALAITLNKQKQTIVQTLDTLPKGLKILADDRTKLVALLQSLSKLGATATSVIDASQKTFTASLVDLDPVLTALNGASADIPNALKIAGTFPFPLGKTLEFVKGDYANLNAFLNLNLSDQLCGVLPESTAPGLCTAATTLLPSSAGSTYLPGASG
jgi:phospholipid/cholesterol/gamma-HCH transport system substrate-binding protein